MVKSIFAPFLEADWKQEELAPFSEFLLTWNGTRPAAGKYLFYVSLKTQDWSPWLLYAAWGSEEQRSFAALTEDGSIRVYQDAVEVLGQALATGFQIRVLTEGDASLNQIRALHIYTNSDEPLEEKHDYCAPVYLDVPGLSQMTLSHSRSRDLCSPASTAAAARYLSNHPIDPLRFAHNSWDCGFDIFGNWVLNVAEASAELGPAWNCWVERLNSFDDIYEKLHQGTPVVVSVRGPLPGSALPYAKGHLVAVIGFDPLEKAVICMDPAFPSDSETHVRYNLSDFIQAWIRRGKIAYVFSRS